MSLVPGSKSKFEAYIDFLWQRDQRAVGALLHRTFGSEDLLNLLIINLRIQMYQLCKGDTLED